MSPCSTKTRCFNLISYCFFDTPVGKLELDTFVESPQDVFCSVVFLRGSRIRGSRITFYFGKGRVLPKKLFNFNLDFQTILLTSPQDLEKEKSLTIKIKISCTSWTESTTKLQ